MFRGEKNKPSKQKTTHSIHLFDGCNCQTNWKWERCISTKVIENVHTKIKYKYLNNQLMKWQSDNWKTYCRRLDDRMLSGKNLLLVFKYLIDFYSYYSGDRVSVYLVTKCNEPNQITKSLIWISNGGLHFTNEIRGLLKWIRPDTGNNIKS